jgi:predicted metal-dependent HD superfamily phosphohydrolase
MIKMNLQEVLNKWNIKCDLKVVLSMWNESHRHYHTLDHLNDLISQINEFKNESNLSEKEYEKLLLTALFHDIVYDPMRQDNEEKSAEFFIECCVEKNSDIQEIKTAILETKTHQSTIGLSTIFNKFDMDIVDRDIGSLMNWESGIYEEFKGYGKDAYKEGRLKFLESLLDKHIDNTDNLLELIDWVKTNY